MAAGDGHATNNFKEQLLLGNINLATDTFRLALYTDAYAASMLDGNPAYSSTNEIAVANYSAGGATLSGLAVSQDDTNDRAAWDASDVTFTSLGAATIQRGVLYDVTLSNVICIIWEIATNSNGGNYVLQFGTNGILTLT